MTSELLSYWYGLSEHLEKTPTYQKSEAIFRKVHIYAQFFHPGIIYPNEIKYPACLNKRQKVTMMMMMMMMVMTIMK